MRIRFGVLCAAVAVGACLAYPATAFAAMTATLQSTLHPMYFSLNSYFGSSVDIQGGTAAVGDFQESRVSVFSSSNGSWTETGEYPADTQLAHVALSNDDLAIAGGSGALSFITSRASGAWAIPGRLVNDGFVDIDGEHGVASSYTALTLYTRSGGAWTPVYTLPWAGNAGPVSLSGTTFAAVTADGANVGIFDIVGDSIVQVGQVPVTWSFFGAAVSLSGDALAVGGGDHVDVYRRGVMGWQHEASLLPSSIAPDPSHGASDYGISLSLDGDRLAVGAPYDLANPGGKRGSVFIFTRDAGVWTESLKIPAETVPYDDGFGPRGPDYGRAVALDGDQLIVGAQRETSVGAAYIYRLADFGTGHTAVSIVSSAAWDGWISGSSSITFASDLGGPIWYQWDSTDPSGWQGYLGIPVAPLPGIHVLNYYSEGPGGFDAVQSKVVKVDTAPPGVGNVVQTRDGSDLVLSWDPAYEFESGIDRYDLFVDNIYAGRTTGTSFRFTGLDLNVRHTLAVVAVDHVGNQTRAESTYPQGPLPEATVTVSPAAPDGSGGWYRTNPVVTLVPPSGGYTWYRWETGTWGPYYTTTTTVVVPDGRKTLTHMSSHPFWGAGAAYSLPFNVDSQPPSAPAPSVSAATSTSADIAWPAVSDATSGLDHYVVFRDGSQVATTAATTYRLAPLTAGTTYTVEVQAIDAAGNGSARGAASVRTTGGAAPYHATLPGGVQLDFSSVTDAGASDAAVVVPANMHTAPANFRVIQGAYYDISTTAQFSGEVTVTVPYDPAGLNGASEASLKLFHWKDGGWQDITVSVDTVNHTVSGRTSSFSPFGVFGPSGSGGGALPTSNTPASSTWSLAALVAAALAAAFTMSRRPARP